ncbi:unnamed protein product [Danaus chrysippus]|uniref:(African queen) hypothetical protein n=1 Tax=Danaus chrysippus TaxID=151541 RepID=A0A8J2QVR5_9NEOP|nr:unnamed protein product [Danaus chrysippus]
MMNIVLMTKCDKKKLNQTCGKGFKLIYTKESTVCILRDNKALCKWKWRENFTLPVTLSKDMMGRTSAWAGWPVDPRRSAGQRLTGRRGAP